MREWTDKGGNKRVSAEVVADNVYFGDSKKDGESDGRRGGDSSYGGSSSGEGDKFEELADDDGDLPF